MRRAENRKEKTPDVWTEEKILDIVQKLNDYIDQVNIPIVAEFCYLHNVRKQRLYEEPRMSDSIKRLLEKKEAALEKHGLAANNTMAIFSLKQLGWRDKSEVELKVNSLAELFKNESDTETDTGC